MEKEIFYSLNPSQQLILLCSCIKVDESKKYSLEKIIEHRTVDWNQIINDAFRNSILPFIYFHLKNLELLAEIPENIKDKMEKFYHFNTARNAWILLSLEKVAEVLNKKNIPFILLQGSPLLADVYQDPSLRYLSDIDILIKENDIPNIEDIIAPLGWKMSDHPGDKNWCIKNLNHLPLFFRQGEPVALEIHFKLPFPEGKKETKHEWIWENVSYSRIRSQEVSIPSPENMILHLSMHISKKSHINDLTILLRHCCDISAILERYGESGINADYLIDTAKRTGLSEALYHSLKVSDSIIRKEFFKKIVDKISNDVSKDAKEFSEFVSNCLTEADKSIKVPLDGFELFFRKKGFFEKLNFFLRHILCPTLDFMEKEYGVSKSEKRIYLYYLLRPFLLAKKFSWTRAIMAYRIAKMKE